PLFARAASAAFASEDHEVVELAHFESVVTELGVLDALAAGRLAEARDVADELL
ncbi:MAG: hypothetical protein GWN79_01470, partial [Actinobacteria bacterium]|nr:hypothetical protein [Actinomycetota bacterium]NIS28892.1 hypothetical protein [Actinomycetota bacterium]NIT94232.1 hypothetical protein [Actinomycetota bacterium]NIU17838.1 hypothetical protein [Actinomycetota bacterium]NIU64328.1 hypothetical protein [Actinomycetota bacterium]